VTPSIAVALPFRPNDRPSAPTHGVRSRTVNEEQSHGEEDSARVLIVTPTYEEAPNIAELLRRIRGAVPGADILVVDDASPDGTGAIAREVASELSCIDVLQRDGKDGLGSAYRAGFGYGIARGYDVLIQIDADLSHDAEVIPKLCALISGGADVAIGSRYITGGSIPHWPWYRRVLSRYGNFYACFVLGLPIHDTTSGFRAYRASALESAHYETTRAKGYGFQIETAYRASLAGTSVVEYPICFLDRIRGYSKMTWKIAAEELLLVTWWGIRDRLLTRIRKPDAANRQKQVERRSMISQAARLFRRHTVRP